MRNPISAAGLFAVLLALISGPRASFAQPAESVRLSVSAQPVFAPPSAGVPSRVDLRYRLLHAGGLEAGGSAMNSEPVHHPAAVFAMSAVLPGAGQAWNRQWLKAAVAVALETVLVTGYVVTRSRGLDAEDEFRAFAHEDWSPAQYARWINDYRVYLQEEVGTNITAPPVDIVETVDFSNPGAWTRADREAVDEMVDQINAIERQSVHPETGAAFSHQLPEFGDQQYYELIGKYFQFAPGWFDYPDWITGDGMFTPAIDPELSGPGGTKRNVSDTFYAYARDHADAQDMLRTASRLSVLFIVNHLVAGIDAAVTARIRRNRASAASISPTFEMAMSPGGRPAPKAGLSLRF